MSLVCPQLEIFLTRWALNYGNSFKFKKGFILFRICLEKTIQFIKNELIHLGYSCEDFLKLNEASFNHKNSSREVLIAIGWLFNSYEVIEIFFENSSFRCQQEYFKGFENQVKDFSSKK